MCGCCQPDLALKSLGAERRREIGVQHFEGDIALMPYVVREVHCCHAAATELAPDLVATSEVVAQLREYFRHVGGTGG